MKHNWNFFQNESADAEKKALLPVLVIPLVVIVLMIVIVLAEYGKKRAEEPPAVTETAETEEQEPETMAETGESAETETDTAAEAETEASEENGDPYATENLTHDSVPEVLSLMKKYFTARASGDADTMNEIYGVSGLSFTELEHEKTRLRSNSKYVQEFDNITTYVRDGATADSWLVYALADIKFHSVKTAAPMIMWCYVEKDSEGNYHIIKDENLSEEVRKLASSVNVKLKEALNSDEDLNSVYGVLRDGSPVYDNGDEPEVVIGDGETSESGEDGAAASSESSEGSVQGTGAETAVETTAGSEVSIGAESGDSTAADTAN